MSVQHQLLKEVTEAMASVTGDYSKELMAGTSDEFSSSMESNKFISVLVLKETNILLTMSTTMLLTTFKTSET